MQIFFLAIFYLNLIFYFDHLYYEQQKQYITIIEFMNGIKKNLVKLIHL